MIEPNDQDWGLCDHGPIGWEFDDDAEEDYGDAWDEFDEQDDDDDEWPLAHMARVAADIEAGRAEVLDAGHQAAGSFLAGWDWQRYLTDCRGVER